MKRKVKLLIIFITTMSLLILGYFSRIDRFGFSSIKWADILVINGYQYDGEYTGQNYNNEDRVIVDVNLIGEKIGEVKFMLQGNVKNPYYIKRNLDASILNKGTEIYEIKNERQTIAVKIDTEFYLYLKSK